MPAPKYREIADSLRDRIERNEWAPGQIIPKMTELATEYRVSRNVVAAAVKELEKEGFLWAVPKKGTVVQVPGSRSRIRRGDIVVRDVKGTVEGMEIPHGSYSFPSGAHDLRWIVHGPPRRSIEPVGDRPAELLGVHPGTPVLRRRRVSGPEGQPPYQLADTWIHPAAVQDAPRVADPQPGPGGVLDRLEEAGHGPIAWHEIARSRMPTKEEATLLEIPADRAVMEIARVGVSARTGEEIEVTLCVIPGDRVETYRRIQRDDSAAYPRE